MSRRRKLGRRDLLKAAPLATLGAAGAAVLAGAPRGAEAETRGICRLCTMHCGVAARTRGARLVRVEGDLASHTRGFICHHGYAMREVVHAPDRLRRPLRREGGTHHELSWDRALDEIAERLEAVKRQHGARALAIHTGWPFVRHPLVGLLHRLCAAFGTPNLSTVASLCEAAGRMGKALTAGSKYEPDLGHARTLIVWGANPTFTAPPFSHRVASFAHEGRKLIVIDPVRTELAIQANLHLQPRPGTDGALALGLMNVVIAEGLFDRAFVEAHTVGFEPLRELVSHYEPARVAEITGVKAELIARAARTYATNGPSAIWDGLGVEHHDNAVQTVRAISCLEGLCGFLDAQGGARLLARPEAPYWGELLPGLVEPTTPEPVPPTPSDKPIGYDAHPLFEVFNRQAQGNLYARAIEEGQPYPLRALILIGSNALVTAPGAARLRQAAKKLDLLVTVDPFMSASGLLSDYVLPAGTFAEAPDVSADDRQASTHGLVAPQHESWPDWRIVFELARRLGLGRYFPWGSLREALDAPRVPYLPDPARALIAEPPAPGAPLPRFPTPSGKVELWSETMARFGYPALPEWSEPRARPWNAGGAFPLFLVTGPRTRPFINSQFRSVPSIRSKMPEATARVHPKAAREAGLEGARRVVVVSPHGRAEFALQVTRDVQPEVVVVSAGWAGGADANQLTDPNDLDPVSGFPAFRSGVCRLERA